jgi:hypothetical protein
MNNPSIQKFQDYRQFMPVSDPYLAVLKGGLGNQLFQLSATWTIADTCNSGYLIKPCIKTKHSDIYYFDNLFKNWSHLLTAAVPRRSIVLNGYYQDHFLIEPRYRQFVDQLCWNGYDDLSRYNEIDDSMFIHLRGGDYLQRGFSHIHHVDLKDYYKSALERCSNVKHSYLFTNDRAYLESLNWFDDVRHTVVRGDNEIHDLFLMSQCAKGGIAANSTFSWWGLYLDRTREHLVIPERWFNIVKSSQGYYFPEATVIPV